MNEIVQCVLLFTNLFIGNWTHSARARERESAHATRLIGAIIWSIKFDKIKKKFNFSTKFLTLSEVASIDLKTSAIELKYKQMLWA